MHTLYYMHRLKQLFTVKKIPQKTQNPFPTDFRLKCSRQSTTQWVPPLTTSLNHLLEPHFTFRRWPKTAKNTPTMTKHFDGFGRLFTSALLLLLLLLPVNVNICLNTGVAGLIQGITCSSPTDYPLRLRVVNLHISNNSPFARVGP